MYHRVTGISFNKCKRFGNKRGDILQLCPEHTVFSLLLYAIKYISMIIREEFTIDDDVNGDIRVFLFYRP